jgi:hypothetical protein
MKASVLLPILVGLLLCFLGAFGSGCIVPVHDHGHGHHKETIRPAHDCPPSHYWDGEKCRHKGKGHGARKHDED